MLRRAVVAVTMLWAGTAVARLDDFPGIERPLYPEVVVPTDDSYSADAELFAFRRAVDKASEALVKWPDGSQSYDPEAMLPLLADEVELFIGRQRTPFQEEFMFIGRQPPRSALEILGRLSRPNDGADPVIVHQRYGMHVLGRLALEPTVGRSPWLDGRICTASYGKLEWPVWSSLWKKLEFFHKEDWLIATVVRPDFEEVAPSGWPKRYQVVPAAREQKRAAGSIRIITPEGHRVFFADGFDRDEGYFASYLNEHLCFTREDGEWRISAVALRLA